MALMLVSRTLCGGIDCLSLILSHRRLARCRNDELRQISDTGSCGVELYVNPPSAPSPSLRCNPGQERHRLRLTRTTAD